MTHTHACHIGNIVGAIALSLHQFEVHIICFLSTVACVVGFDFHIKVSMSCFIGSQKKLQERFL